jgi:hypothetical protein
MRHDRHGAFAMLEPPHAPDRRDDAALRVDRPLPPAHRSFGLREECIGHALELVGRQEAGGTAVVLAQVVVARVADAPMRSPDAAPSMAFCSCCSGSP